MYVYGIVGDHYAEEAIQAWRDRSKVAPCGCPGVPWWQRRRCDPPDWRERGDVLPKFSEANVSGAECVAPFRCANAPAIAFNPARTRPRLPRSERPQKP